MIFSELAIELPGELNSLYEIKTRLEDEGSEIIDLVRGSPNEHGIIYPPELLDEIIAKATMEARFYRPNPFGQLAARNAIAEFYNQQNISVTADRIVLTPGTSISYWYCFKLLAEAGEEILCPSPSYPLLEHIARISSVKLQQYNLVEGSSKWSIDFDHLITSITKKTRAIVLISPHNPTGMVCSEKDLELLIEIAKKYDLPIIADEVFSEFLHLPKSLPRPMNISDAPLVLTLNGLSKSFALPGIKVGWIAISGQDWLVKRTLNVLEIFSDTFLPVSEIAQFSTPGIFQQGRKFQNTYKEWVNQGRKIAIDAFSQFAFPEPEGGFYLTLPIKSSENEFCEQMLRDHQILIHPGHFYDVQGQHLVLSFVQSHEILKKALSKITQAL